MNNWWDDEIPNEALKERKRTITFGEPKKWAKKWSQSSHYKPVAPKFLNTLQKILNFLRIFLKFQILRFPQYQPQVD